MLKTSVRLLIGVGMLFAATLPSVRAQTDPGAGGYQIGEGAAPAPAATQDANSDQTADAGPVRLARFSYVTGDVTWRPDETVDWSNATVNLPIREGAQIWVTQGRAEIQFDDGSYLRLGNGAVVTLQTLYSDSNGEFTEVRVSEGLTALRLIHAQSTYQIDTPTLSVKTSGPAKVRIGVADSTEVAVRQGKATIEDGSGDQSLYPGDYVDVTDPNAAFDVAVVPSPDSWDQFNDDRDASLDSPDPHVPAQIGLVCANLSAYGSWRSDPSYGSVWCPSAVPAGWCPYRYGHWVWCDPFGWTWVSDEPWGWAPYHYGAWVNCPYGWCWAPGPRVQYWSPAVVHFTYYQNNVCWAPLAPEECRYPSRLAVAFRGGDWSLFFSIGGCAVYSPAGPNFCEPRPWRNADCNGINISIQIGGPARHDDGDPFHFQPSNARFACVTGAPIQGFGSGARFTAVGSGQDAFMRGHAVFAGSTSDGRPIAGPDIHPTLTLFTPTHHFRQDLHAPATLVDRPVFRGDVAPGIQRFSAHGGAFFNRNGQTAGNQWSLKNGAGQSIPGAAPYHPGQNGGGNRTLGQNPGGGRPAPTNPANSNTNQGNRPQHNTPIGNPGGQTTGNPGWTHNNNQGWRQTGVQANGNTTNPANNGAVGANAGNGGGQNGNPGWSRNNNPSWRRPSGSGGPTNPSNNAGGATNAAAGSGQGGHNSGWGRVSNNGNAPAGSSSGSQHSSNKSSTGKGGSHDNNGHGSGGNGGGNRQNQ